MTEVIFYLCECCLNDGVAEVFYYQPYKGRKLCSYCGTPINFEKARTFTYKLQEEMLAKL